MGLEGLFMEWIIKALKPNGKAFIVVPDGILIRQNDKRLRQFILDNCYVDAIISLPINTFFRNSKKTYILALTKKEKSEDDAFEKQTDPVFTYLVSEIGESRDINRFRISQDDLNEAVILFQYFSVDKKRFRERHNEEENKDKRCKLWEIEEFKSEKNWAVDRWWTKAEKIELGIIKKENIADLNNFSEFVEEVSDKLKKISGLIKEIGKDENRPSNFKEILLSDVFEIKRGLPKYTDEFINKNPGEYPVYSAQTTNEGIAGRINCYDYDCECLTWVIRGNAGTVFMRKGKFSITKNCGVLIPKNQNLLLSYLFFYLSENLKEYALGSQRKGIIVEIIKNVKIKIPITKESEFDVSKQKEIAEKYQCIKELRDLVELEKQKINDLVINIEKEKLSLTRKSTIDEIFDLSLGTNGGKFTKSFIDKHQGKIPVYGASKNKNAIYGKVEDNLPDIKYFENCLTWNKNGSIGKVFFRRGRFSLSVDVIPLIVRDEYKEKFDLLYLKYALEKETATHNFGFTNKVGKDKIKNIEIKIPTTSQKEFDLEKQREIAGKYKQIEEIKEKIKAELEKIENTKVDIGI